MRVKQTLLALAGLAALAAGHGPGAHAKGAAAPQGDLKAQTHLFEVGVMLGAYLPPAKHELYRGTPHRAFEPAAFTGGLRLAYLPLSTLGVEVEGLVMPTSTRSGASALLYAVRGHLIAQLPLARRWAPFLVIGGGLLGVSSGQDADGNDQDAAFHWGAGIKYYPTDFLALRLDLRHIVSARAFDQDYASHFEVLAGVSWVFGWKNPPPVKDSDADGVPDARDKCPKVAAKTADGCPADTDKDGVPDARDKCPKVAAKTADGCPADADKDGVPDTRDKCPKVAAKTADGCPADTDKDGVPDTRDKCPKVAAKTADGCPTDTDKDGVPDARDKCPKVAAKTADGCPADADKDGIPDAADKCPNKPETRNGYQDGDGCPDTLPKAVKRFTGAIRGITFARGKALIRPRSFRVLNRAVKVLKRYPALLLKIRGHTDSTGAKAANRKLSLARAQAVKDYLVRKGIAATRLEVQGVGSDEPVASNKTWAGRAKNRRIEFKLLTGAKRPH